MSPSEQPVRSEAAALRQAATALGRAAGGRESALALDGELLAGLLGAATRAYAARRAAGDPLAPFAGAVGDGAPTATDVAITAAAMLDDAGIEIFELGLWRTWGDPGRAATTEPQR
jgi:hypothetical protein